MAFRFTDLSVVLTAFHDNNNAPRAELKVQTCGGSSLALQFATCETNTQRCNTRPDDMVVLLTPSTTNLAMLQQQLQEMLDRFGPAGTAVQNTPQIAARKTAKKPTGATAMKATKKPSKKPSK